MPWEETDDYVRSGHRSPDDFESDSLRTITISEEEGIKAVIGKPKGKDTTEVQSYLFAKAKEWTLGKAKEWFEKHKSEALHAYSLFFDLRFLADKADPNARIFPWSMPARYYMKPGRMIIYGTALTAGKTRKGDVFNCEELRRGARSLIGGPIEVFEHTWDVGESRWLPFPDNAVLDGEEVEGRIEYIAGVSESRVQQLIREGVIDQVSVNAICRHVPAEDPGQCDGMILNGFCLLHKDSLAASPGTSVKVWNCLRADARRPEGDKPPESDNGVLSMSGNGNSKLPDPNASATPDPANASNVPSQKPQQIVSGHGPVAGQAEPSIEDRVKMLEQRFEGFQTYVDQQFTGINAKLDTLIQVKSAAIPPPTSNISVQKTAAQWTTEYVNNLSDECFAYIEDGGIKDEQGKTTPRSLRHLEFKNDQGEIDHDHLVAALQALKGARQGEPLPYADKAKPKLCAAVKTYNESHHDNPIQSDVCNIEPPKKTENVAAAVKPIEPQEHLVVLTEQEILGVLTDKRRFTPALQLNGILDLLEAKKREAA